MGPHRSAVLPRATGRVLMLPRSWTGDADDWLHSVVMPGQSWSRRGDSNPLTTCLQVGCSAPAGLSDGAQAGRSVVLAVICGMLRLVFVDRSGDRTVAMSNVVMALLAGRRSLRLRPELSAVEPTGSDGSLRPARFCRRSVADLDTPTRAAAPRIVCGWSADGLRMVCGWSADRRLAPGQSRRHPGSSRRAGSVSVRPTSPVPTGVPGW